MKLVSASDGRSRWRLISSRPKWLIWPTWMRARSFFSASFRRRSTIALCLRRLHVDEVDDDQAGEVAQAQLARHLVGGLQVGAQRRLLDAALARRAAGVDVDRDQRLGLVDHQIAAGAQLHGRRQHRVELRLDLVFRRTAAGRRCRARAAPSWRGSASACA